MPVITYFTLFNAFLMPYWLYCLLQNKRTRLFNFCCYSYYLWLLLI